MSNSSLFSFLEKVVIGVLLAAILGVSWRIGLLQILYSGTASTPIWDFEIYYRLARDVLAGVHPYQVSYMQTLGPPLVIAPFIPFSVLPYTSAVKLYFLGSVMGGWLASFLLARVYSHKHAVLISLLFSLVLLTSFPARFTVIVGQPHLLLLPFIVLVLLPVNYHLKTMAAAVLLWFKTFFVFPSLIVLLNRNLSWSVVAVVILVGLASLTVIKPVYYVDFLQHRLGGVLLTPSHSEGADYYNQSLRASLGRVELEPLYPLAVICLAALVLWFSIRTENFEVAVLGSLMLSPVLWQHYLVLVFPIMILLLPRVLQSWKLGLLWFTGVVCWWIELPRIHTADFHWGVRLLASHYFYSLLIFLCLSLLTWKRPT